MGQSSRCYLMNGLNLMKGRRLGPRAQSEPLGTAILATQI